MTISREFADWALSLDVEDVPAAVQRRAALHILDGIGVAMAAARFGAAPTALLVARSFGSCAEATVIGSNRRAAAPVAALANGLLMHALDFDDTHTAGLVHATSVTVPAALAVAQREGVSGARVLAAVVAGYELVGRISRAAPHGFHRKGFHATSVCGTFSSALVAALLSGLSLEQTVNALGIAGSQSSGNMEFLATGASTKQIHPGWASLAGVVAATLAGNGASGPPSILEGHHGLYALYSDVEPDLASITAGLGSAWETLGIEMKPYPACHLVHRSLDVAEELHSRVDLGSIEEIIVTMPEDSMPIVCEPAEFKQAPRSSYEAKFSVQWSVAAMLVDGRVGIETYESSRIGRADVARISRLVRVVPNVGHAPAAEVPGEISIHLAGGTEVALRSEVPKGASTIEDRILSKLRVNAAGDADTSDELIAAVLELAAAPDLKRLEAALYAVAATWEPRI